MQYWGSRTGALALSQFPLITVLGTKNNVVSGAFGFICGFGEVLIVVSYYVG